MNDDTLLSEDSNLENLKEEDQEFYEALNHAIVH